MKRARAWAPVIAIALIAMTPVAAQAPTGAPVPPTRATEPAVELDDDTRAETQLQSVLDASNDLSEVRVEVNHGVARLRGTVPTRDVHDRIVRVADELEGIVYVDDELSEPVNISDRIGPLRQRLDGWLDSVVEKAPLVGIAILALVAFALLGKFISRRDRFYSAVVKREMLRDLARRLTVIAFGITGVVVALEILDATTLAGSVLGAAGVLGLALGLAFRDIMENYLASFLLATRRPFELGDSVKIGDQEGKVIRLTMRETVLVTFDGSHLSMPNATVFKANVLNYSHNPHRRFDFIVGAGVNTDLGKARKVGVEALRDTAGTLSEPAPFSVIEQVGDANVAIRFYGWIDQRETDFQKARSEAICRVMAALETAGVEIAEPIYRVHLISNEDVDASATEQPSSGAPSARQPRPAKKRVGAVETTQAVDVSADVSINHHIERERSRDSQDNLLIQSDDVARRSKPPKKDRWSSAAHDRRSSAH